jgi:serine protease Do
MATRRSLLAALAGFVGGGAAATYTDYPERWDLPERSPLPATPETAEPTPMPTTEPGETPDPDSLRGRARATGLDARPSVLYVEVDRGGNRYGAGTAWVLDRESGFVVTNGHVVDGAANVTCYALDGREVALEVAETSLRPDVALLRTDDVDSLPAALPTGSVDDLEPDRPLVQVGHPGGVGHWVISLGRLRRGPGFFDRDRLVSTVPSAQGNSGSPLLTLDGRVVGLTYAGVPETTRRPGEAPEPSDPRVRESFAVDTDSLHVPVGTVRETVAEWTRPETADTDTTSR